MHHRRIEIRSANAEDKRALVELLAAQLGEHDVRLDRPGVVRAVAGLLARPERGRFLVAVERDQVVGFAALSFLWTVEHGGRAAWLDELYVLPERRGGGIGRALLRAALREAARAGAAAVDLEVEEGHERAALLYQREGFRPLARRRWALRMPRRPGRHTRQRKN
jgi:GNAT superfamily N-acetyltransferase